MNWLKDSTNLMNTIEFGTDLLNFIKLVTKLREGKNFCKSFRHSSALRVVLL